LLIQAAEPVGTGAAEPVTLKSVYGEMEVEIVPGKGHEECPEIFHSQKMVDFILKHGLGMR
jgi:hypothetical protein